MRLSARLRLVALAAWIAAFVGVAAGAGDRNFQKTVESSTGALKDGEPGADELAALAAASQVPAEPAWLKKRTGRYAALFKGSSCDVLVVPMQVEGSAFDRPSRDIMSADLAQAVASTGVCVADPYLVDLALGEGLRRRSASSVEELAQAMGAREVVTAYCGHYRPGRMRVTLQRSRADRGDASSPRTLVAARSFEFTGYDELHPSFIVFREHLAEMMAAIGTRVAPSAEDRSVRPTMPIALPASLDEYLHPVSRPATAPLANAATLAFLAMQTPSSDWRAADRLFSKAWVALESVDGGDAVVRRLRARILLHLHERPFALSILRADAGPEAEGLRAVLNGNLPQARQALSRSRDRWDRYFLGIEVSDLELAYNRDPRTSAKRVMDLVGKTPYAPFVQLRLQERDEWGVGSTLPVRSVLIDSLPVDHRDLPGKARGAADLLTELQSPKGELASIRHVHRLVEEQPRLWCCNSFAAQPRPSDLLDMLDARIEYELGRHAYYYISPQGRYEEALDVLASYDEELAGSPYAETIRATALWELVRRGDLQHREEWKRKMHEAARLVGWWSPAQTQDTAQAVPILALDPPDPSARALYQKLANDEPIRHHWQVFQDPAREAQRLAFSTDDPDALIQLLEEVKGEARAGYLKELDVRFLGSPKTTWRRLHETLPASKTAEQMRAEIKVDGDNWELYRSLADLQFQQRAYGEARHTVLSYPPFNQADPKDLVTLANNASDWGHALLWLGAISDAEPLLERSARYNTGAASGGYSAARLALLRGNYLEAAGLFLDIGAHYDDQTAYRELDSLLFAAGQNAPAWSLFERVSARFETSDFLTAAMVGHRRDAKNPNDVSRWYAQRLAKADTVDQREALRSHAFLEQTIDRSLTADQVSLVQSLSAASDVKVHEDGKLYLSHASPENAMTIGPSEFGQQRHPKLSPGAPIPDKYALATRALAAMQGGRYKDAMATFDEFSSFYRIEREFVLPYFAFSAARSGDRLGLQAYLDQLPPERQGFEVNLARAVFAAMGGKPAEAHVLLDKDLASWASVHANYFPASAYQYINVCTLLYEALGNATYRDAALTPARVMRRVEPAFAFGHAAVAYLATNEKERVDALVSALHLDPLSRWAAMVPPKLQAAARASLEANGNPFLRESGERPWRAIISTKLAEVAP